MFRPFRSVRRDFAGFSLAWFAVPASVLALVIFLALLLPTLRPGPDAEAVAPAPERAPAEVPSSDFVGA